MGKAHTISKVTTVLFCVIAGLALLAALCGAIGAVLLMQSFDWVGEVIGNASEHELTGGYEILGALGVGQMNGLLFLGVAVVAFIGAMYFATSLVPSIAGIVLWRKFLRVGNAKLLFADAVVKIADVLAFTIGWVVLLASTPDAIGGVVLLFSPFLLLAAASVAQLLYARKAVSGK